MKLFGKPLELVILDVDGVILDLVSNFQNSFEEAARRCNFDFEPIRTYIAAVSAGDTHGKASLSEGIRELWPNLEDERYAQLSKTFREVERENPYSSYEGSVDAIHWFREQNIPIALCTTNDMKTLEHRFEQVKVDMSWFSALSTWEHKYPKPDPRALDPIFEKIPVNRDSAVYVGDWYPDLETARGANVRFVAVLSGGIPKHAFIREGVKEDHILEKLSDLPELITVE